MECGYSVILYKKEMLRVTEFLGINIKLLNNIDIFEGGDVRENSAIPTIRMGYFIRETQKQICFHKICISLHKKVAGMQGCIPASPMPQCGVFGWPRWASYQAR